MCSVWRLGTWCDFFLVSFLPGCICFTLFCVSLFCVSGLDFFLFFFLVVVSVLCFVVRLLCLFGVGLFVVSGCLWCLSVVSVCGVCGFCLWGLSVLFVSGVCLCSLFFCYVYGVCLCFRCLWSLSVVSECGYRKDKRLNCRQLK